ncbi:MAG: hypothetical protein M1838_003559 [Thelocarpon superellum]|nr:MAG: hypothetical protein M1838_003559 [Thelocarpon superellum]
MSEEEASQPLLRADRQAVQHGDHDDSQEIRHDAPSSTFLERLPLVRPRLQRFLTSKVGHYSVLLLVSLDVSCIFADLLINLVVCEQRHPDEALGIARDALGTAGLVFSCLFMAELMASIWAFGLSYFNSRFHCFDAFVIVLGFVVDVLLHGTLEEIASLVVVLRLWRVFKIIEEFSAGAAEQMDALAEKIERLEMENRELRKELDARKAFDGTPRTEDT